MSTGTGTPGETPPPPAPDRATVFAAGPQKISRRVVFIMLGAAAAIALLGVAGEDLFSRVALNPVAGTTTHTTVSTSVPSAGPPLDAPLPAFMGMTTLTPAPADNFALHDAAGQTVSLDREHGRVVVVTFFNGTCTDICPVLEAEIARADADLGVDSRRVLFLAVNTDPLEPHVTASTPAVVSPRVAHLRNWYFLGGTEAQLDRVWRPYGITIDVLPSLGVVAHNEAIFFIDRAGRVRYHAVPYANESSSGAFSLPPAEVSRWGAGLATYARHLLGGRS